MSTEAEIKAVSAILQSIDSPIIVECGAHCGEDSQWMRESCGNRHAHNIMIEPDPRNVAIIRANRMGRRTTIIQAAVTDYSGVVDFHFATDPRSEGGRSGSGSIRAPKLHTELFPDITFGPPTQVECVTLDGIARDFEIDHIDLLWIDVQGNENRVIAGARDILKKTRYLFIEAEQTELYEGQVLRDGLLALLSDFAILQELDYNLLMERRRR